MMKKQIQGFTLLELLAGLVIVTIGLSAALPSYLRNVKQGDVDRYTQQLEAGFFSLRAQLGQQKTSCTLNLIPGSQHLSHQTSYLKLIQTPNF